MEQLGYRSYHAANLEAQIASASPVQLVLVLMDGLLDEMTRARAHIVARRFEAKCDSLCKCIDILAGLSSSLNEDGSEMVAEMVRLYDFCIWRLNQAGCNLDAAPIDEVMSLVTTMRDGWRGLQANG